MTTTLATINAHAHDDALAPLLHEEEQLIADALQSARSENTRINYASQWRKWLDWAQERGVQPLPAEPEQLARFLARQAASGRKIATLRLIMAAVNAQHKIAGFEPPGKHPGFQEAMAGFARRLAREPDQAAPLDAQALAAIRATATRPRPPRFTRETVPGGVSTEFVSRVGEGDGCGYWGPAS